VSEPGRCGAAQRQSVRGHARGHPVSQLADVEDAMTRQQFLHASQRVRAYGSMAMGLVASVLMGLSGLLVLSAFPVVQDFPRLLRNRFPDEVMVGLVAGLLGGVILAPLLLVPWAAARWVDRRIGLRCPACRRSITARCRPGEVLRTGRCCLCNEPLFEQDGY
jgi:hypothetical protein